MSVGISVAPIAVTGPAAKRQMHQVQLGLISNTFRADGQCQGPMLPIQPLIPPFPQPGHKSCATQASRLGVHWTTHDH